MIENPDKINQLSEKLEILLKKQKLFQKEIDELRTEINSIKSQAADHVEIDKQRQKIIDTPKPESETKVENQITNRTEQFRIKQDHKSFYLNTTKEFKTNLEGFIGTNLINKVGIIITLLGVGIGTRYAISYQLISPLTRIILGYLVGIGLFGFAIKLKARYPNFSAVLLSGSMAIMYFITYLAYSFYNLIPQVLTFFLMVFFTVFTVAAAINYNMQVIANIGLVGAYGVPFLLSEGSGRVEILFSYMTIINIGILIIAFKKYWKPLFYSAFILTWLIFSSWYFLKYQSVQNFLLAFIFLFIFFAVFYATFLAYKLIQKEIFNIENVVLILSNSFIFYGIGYSILSNQIFGEHLLGLFTFSNALIHFAVSTIIYRQKLYDRNLFYFVTGLVLVFITIAIPVQLNGNWVTLLWACEAASLFWIGRTKNVQVYEGLSYILMYLAFFSIIQDWLNSYNNYYPGHPELKLTPLFNINFLSSLLVIAAFSFINIIHNKKYSSSLAVRDTVSKIISYSIPCILLILLYCSFLMEVINYGNQLYADSYIEIKKAGIKYSVTYQNYDLLKFRNIWTINYSLLFLSILSLVNIKRIKSNKLGIINLFLNVICIGIFLLFGLYILSELRESYLSQSLSEYYNRGVYHIVIRYISIAFICLLLVTSYIYIHQDFLKKDFAVAFDLMLNLTIIWIASSELINWMYILHSTQSYKLALSLLWGMLALFIIAFGIREKKKHLRIGAIVLFGITLIKLFFYDISYLDTIAKTIVLLSLGILLLVISFLYNKYKHILFEGNEK